jgi:hypothetical protein
MPCYEPELDHQKREREFLVAALCFATENLDPKVLVDFPGLAEWKKRHDVIDDAENPSAAQSAYDGNDPYAPPKFMQEFMEAFPSEPAKQAKPSAPRR